MPQRKKELSIETLRGFVIIFMVAGHVIGTSAATGMRVAPDSGWRYFYFTFEYLRMPLFTVISGFVYALWPIGDYSIFRFLEGKARRILLPLVFVGTLHFLFQHFTPGTNGKMAFPDIWKIYFFPYDHFWFLQSIFLIFVFVVTFDHFRLLATFRNWLIVFLLAAIFRNFTPSATNFFSYLGFLNLLPFFLLGLGLNRFVNVFTDKRLLISAFALFIISVAIQQYNWFTQTKIKYFEYHMLSLFVACSGIILLFYIRKNITIISRIGYYAFGIYLFHVFGTAGSRIFLMKIGITQYSLIFIVGVIFGIAVPIIVEILFEKSIILRRLFLGLK